MKHTDERRTLIDWGGQYRIYATCKTIIAHQDCVLGRHYHKIKVEKFMLASGQATLIKRPRGSKKNALEIKMEIGETYEIAPFIVHEFHLKKGSILNCLCTHEYDPEDDYEV